MLTVKETMEVTIILMNKGIFDSVAWFNKHTDDEARALLTGDKESDMPELETLSTEADPDIISLIDIWRDEGTAAFSA